MPDSSDLGGGSTVCFDRRSANLSGPRTITATGAARRRRAWLQERHAQARELVVVLLRHAPEAEVARVLDQLPAGDLHRLAGLLAHAAERRQDQDSQQATVPSGERGLSAATPTRP